MWHEQLRSLSLIAMTPGHPLRQHWLPSSCPNVSIRLSLAVTDAA